MADGRRRGLHLQSAGLATGLRARADISVVREMASPGSAVQPILRRSGMPGDRTDCRRRDLSAARAATWPIAAVACATFVPPVNLLLQPFFSWLLVMRGASLMQCIRRCTAKDIPVAQVRSRA